MKILSLSAQILIINKKAEMNLKINRITTQFHKKDIAYYIEYYRKLYKLF